jgi:hypothetical protein
MHRNLVMCLLALAVGSSCASSNTPNYDRAKEIGRNYATTVFDVSVTGERPLGTNENYRIVGHILPVKKRIAIGERFELARGDIISLSGLLTEIDKDHLRLVGHFKGVGPANHPVDIDVDVTIALGIHGGNHYFRDRDLYAAAMGNDYLEIHKVEMKNLPNQATSEPAPGAASSAHQR